MKYLKLWESFNSENNFNYELNHYYEYHELPQPVKDDIDAQFDQIREINDGETPQDYYYKYVILQPEELEEYIMDHFNQYNIDDEIQTPYMQDLIEGIQKSGLQHPPVGEEGNHRALVHWYLKKPMPYLEMIKKEK